MTGHWREVRKLRFDRRQLLIYAVTDKAWTGKLSLKEQVEEALKGGATMVQLREKELDKGNFEEVLRTAWDIRRITEEYNVPLMIDDNLELALADLQTVENRLTKVERKAQAKDKEAAAEYAVLSKLVEALREGKAARSVELTKEEALTAKSYQLLTAKPMIYVANMSEDEIADPENNAYYKLVKAYAEAENNDVTSGCTIRIDGFLKAVKEAEKNAK